jgi:hypothetical protein
MNYLNLCKKMIRAMMMLTNLAMKYLNKYLRRASNKQLKSLIKKRKRRL